MGHLSYCRLQEVEVMNDCIDKIVLNGARGKRVEGGAGV